MTVAVKFESDFSRLDSMSIEEPIRALQALCATGERNQSAIEFCPCADCQEHLRHFMVVKGEKRVTADFQIIREGVIEKVRIAFPQLSEAQEYPLGVLKAFASEN